MDSWLTYAKQLVAAKNMLPPLQPLVGGAPPMPEAADALYQLDLKCSEEVEASIRWFSRNQEWPRLSTEEIAMLHFRFEFASHVTVILQELSENLLPKGAPPSSIPSPEEDVLEWALIHLWKDHGRIFVPQVLQVYSQL